MGSTYFAVKNVNVKYYVFGKNGHYIFQSKQANGRASDNMLRVVNAVAETDLCNEYKEKTYKAFLSRGAGKKLYINFPGPGRINEFKSKDLMKKLAKLLKAKKIDVDVDKCSIGGIKIFFEEFSECIHHRLKDVIDQAKEMTETRMVEVNSPVKMTKKEWSRRGFENEDNCCKLLKNAMDHFSAKDKPIHLRLSEINGTNEIEFDGLESFYHVGTEKSWDLADIRLDLSGFRQVCLSLKLPIAQEWNGQKAEFMTSPYLRHFYKSIINNKNLFCVVPNDEVKKKRRNVRYWKASFVDGLKGVAMPVPEKFVSRMVFGKDGDTKCSAVIVHEFSPEDEKNIVYEELSDCYRITIKVQELILSIDDVIGTNREPWLFIRKRTSDSVLCDGDRYAGIYYCVVTRSRVFAKKNGDLMDNIMKSIYVPDMMSWAS